MSVTLVKPTVGGDNGTWGTELNTALDLLNSITRGVVKTADESLTSNATLQNDDDLVLPVVASATYIVEWSLVTDGALAADFKYSFTGPASATMTWESVGILTTDTTATAARGATDNATIGTVQTHGTILAGTNSRIDGRGVLTVSTTAGSLQLQWAQNTSTASATRCRAGSWLRATRIS